MHAREKEKEKEKERGKKKRNNNCVGRLELMIGDNDWIKICSIRKEKYMMRGGGVAHCDRAPIVTERGGASKPGSNLTASQNKGVPAS